VFSGDLRREPFPIAQFVQQRLREFYLCGIGAALEQSSNDRGVAGVIGCHGGALDAAQKPRLQHEIGHILEQRSKSTARRAHVVQTFFVRLANEVLARALQRSPFAANCLCHPLHDGRGLIVDRVRRGYFRQPSRIHALVVRSPRLPVVIVLLAIIAVGTWYALSSRTARNVGTVAIYYTKQDGTTLGDVSVSMRPRQAGESSAEHLHNTLLYAAVQAVAGPPNAVRAIRFPPGTRVRSVTVDGSTAAVDLSKEVEQQAGGTFGENGEFKALVYTVTGIRGINALQITVDGARLQSLPGGHLELDEPLHRSDW
jgi:hypothetical protein